MEPVSYSDAVDDINWTAQVKWDGVRCLAYLEDDICRLFNRKLHERTIQYPELQALKKISRSRTVVYDGEIIAMAEGKPSFSAILRRDRAVNPANIKNIRNRLPVSYMIFDIIRYGDRDMTRLTFDERQQVLTDCLTQTENIRQVESFPGLGSRLFKAVVEKNLEGVVLKKSNSPYIPGKKSCYWRKIKNYRRQLCYIGGFTLARAGLRSLLLGIPEGKALLYVGRVSSGLSASTLHNLHDFFNRHLTDKPPFINPPRISGGGLQWVKPVYTVEIEFLEWTDELQLRHPKIIKLDLL